MCGSYEKGAPAGGTSAPSVSAAPQADGVGRAGCEMLDDRKGADLSVHQDTLAEKDTSVGLGNVTEAVQAT